MRDEQIESLKQEILYLRQKLDERDKQILALTDAAAYRMLHPHADGEQRAEPLRSPLENRNEPYRPTLSLEDVKRGMDA